MEEWILAKMGTAHQSRDTGWRGHKLREASHLGRPKARPQKHTRSALKSSVQCNQQGRARISPWRKQRAAEVEDIVPMALSSTLPTANRQLLPFSGKTEPDRTD